MSEIFLNQDLLGECEIELDLSNYAAKSDLKNATSVDTSKFAEKVDLATLISEIDKSDKLETTSVDLSKLSDVVKNEVVKKAVYDELVQKVNAIQPADTGNLVKKGNYNTKSSEIEKKILHYNHDEYITTQELNKLTVENFSARLAQAKLATKADIDYLVKKTDFDDKLKILNKKVTSNKTKHVDNEKKFTNLTNKVAIRIF